MTTENPEAAAGPRMGRPRGYIICLLAGVLVAGPVGWLLGNAKGRTDTRVEAVKAGHARHVIVDDLGNTKFEWMPDPKKPEGPKQP